jgi:hypothetical protein
MKKFAGGVFSFVLMTGLVLFMAVMGLGMVATGSGERRLGEAPEVKLADLAAHAGKTVRFRATLVGEPAMAAAGGERLAFQAVTITHEESSEDDWETVTDYARTAPQVVVASDGEAAVGIVSAGVELAYVPELFEGKTGSGGAMPAGASALLPAGVFTELPDRGFTDVSVRGIRDGEQVTVHGMVEVVDGTPVLRAPEDVPFVVSPLPWEEVVKRAGTSGILSLVFGWGLVAGAAVLAFFSVRNWIRDRRAPAPAGA